MDFLTESQRANHPQASLIPLRIWRGVFQKQITPHEIRLMKSRPKTIRFSSTQWRFDTVYLCFLYAHPKTKPHEFLTYLDASFDSIYHGFMASCLTNRLDILRLMAHKYAHEFNYFMQFNTFRLMRSAVRFSSMKVVDFIFSKYTGVVGEIIQANGYEVLTWCCARTNLNTRLMEYLLSRNAGGFDTLPAAIKFKLVHRAIYQKNERLVHYLLALWPQTTEYLLRTQHYKAYLNAAYSGNSHLLRYFFSLGFHQQAEVVRANQYQLLHVVVKKGHLKLFGELTQGFATGELQELVAAKDYELLYLAAEHGHVRIFNHLFKLISTKECAALTVRLADAFIGAAQCGAIGMMARLLRCFPLRREQMNCAEQYAPYRKAAERGQVRVLHFLAAQFPHCHHEMISSSQFYAFRRAVLFKRTAVIRYLLESHPQAARWMIRSNNFEALTNACSTQDAALVKWLVGKISGGESQWLLADKGQSFLNALQHICASTPRLLMMFEP
ncbi:hypothetical protein [Legionella saoudiensis]|uniref:hypothetical protein n=1 Tax=Legionella saoudiensis TaxID=1750561 RepID=UPI00072FA2AF|nr:hypothetical protein [Legionella saoudiensis]